MTDERILITGGCGFVGTNLLLELVAAGFTEVVIVDRFIRRRLDGAALGNCQVEFVELDIRSPELTTLLESRRISTLIHLAGLHYIPYCNRHPSETWAINVTGTAAVLKAVGLAKGVKRFFLASTAAVYESGPGPHREDDRLGALDIYGFTKQTNERQVAAAAEKVGASFAIGRIFNVVGAFETNPHLIPELVTRLQSSRRIEIGNTETKRDYIHARDVATAIIKMTFGLTRPLDICNIGTGKAYSAREIIQTLSSILGEPIESVQSEAHQRKTDRPMLRADNSKIRRRYQWEPTHSLNDALREAWQYGSRTARCSEASS